MYLISVSVICAVLLILVVLGSRRSRKANRIKQCRRLQKRLKDATYLLAILDRHWPDPTGDLWAAIDGYRRQIHRLQSHLAGFDRVWPGGDEAEARRHLKVAESAARRLGEIEFWLRRELVPESETAGNRQRQ